MQGDFTRDTFQKEKHIRQTLMQQGRVQLDADWNEQTAITARRAETAVEDIVGDCGGSAERAAYGIVTSLADLSKVPAAVADWFNKLPSDKQATITAALAAGDFLLTAGRYYVDGIQCELEAPVLFTQQPDRVGMKPLEGVNLLYLDVWHRHITALDDTSLLDSALGGVDTATRAKTVWQLRAIPLDGGIPAGACSEDIADYNNAIAPSEIRMSAKTRPLPNNDDPCQVPETSGYKGLENQLYHIEIHGLNPDGTAKTWKWSRENGSVVTAITAFVGNEIIVASTGRDDVLGFKDGNIVELLDDRMELENRMRLIAVIDGNPVDGKVKLKAFPGESLPVPADIDLTRHPKLRRWEGFEEVGDEAVELEGGIMVTLDAGSKRCRVGDYWQIPARAATATTEHGDIEWPRDLNAQLKPDNEKPHSIAPRGIEHHYCRLGFFVTNPPEGKDNFTDCRCLWPALTSVPRLFYVSGDGQEVMPDFTAPSAVFRLPRPLIVGVANPQCAARSLSVRFTVVNDALGSLNNGVVAAPGGSPSIQVNVPLDAEGLARCEFSLDAINQTQQVRASLLDDAGREVSLPLVFNANLSIAGQVAYKPGDCATLQKAKSVQEALDILCRAARHGCEWTVGEGGDFSDLKTAFDNLTKRKLKDWRLCLLAGEHEMPSLDGDGLRLQLTGSRAAALVVGGKTTLANLNSLVIRDLSATLNKDDSVLICDGCADVELTNCRMAGGNSELGVLRFLRGKSEQRRIRLLANQISVKRPGASVIVIDSSGADCWMEDNEVKGWISVDGNPPGGDVRERFSAWAGNPNGELTIKPAGGAWHLRDNHLDGVTVGDDVFKQLLVIIAGKRATVGAGFDEVFAHGNTILQSGNLVFARNVHLHATSFASTTRPVCLAFADSGIFVGNQGSARNVVLAKVDAGNHFAEAANLIAIQRV